MLAWLLVFTLAIVVDVLYILWIHCINVGRPWLGAFAATGISACGMLNLINIVDDHGLIAPYLAGAFVGVLLGYKLKQRIK